MRAVLCLLAINATLVISGLSSFSMAAGPDVTAVSPLASDYVGDLDKAKGIGPRFRFLAAPAGLTQACARSVQAHVNEGDFVDDPGARSVSEFRTIIARREPLDSSDANQAPLHEPFALVGDGQISGAACTIFKVHPDARGRCPGIVAQTGYTIVYHFDPIPCAYDNAAVAKAVIAHISVENPTTDRRISECTTQLQDFVTAIDEMLAAKPKRLTEVFAVLNQHFPLRGCNVDEAALIVSKSRYFASKGKNGPNMEVFSLNSGTGGARGVVVTFGLWNDTGDSDLPFAQWSPPSL